MLPCMYTVLYVQDASEPDVHLKKTENWSHSSIVMSTDESDQFTVFLYIWFRNTL